MFGSTSLRKKAEETQKLSDTFRQNISELYLKIESGDLSDEELATVKKELERLQRSINLKIEANTKARPATT